MSLSRYKSRVKLYCSDACRMKAYRARNKPRIDKVETVCHMCYGHFFANPGTSSQYCSNACKQAAYRKRKALAGQSWF